MSRPPADEWQGANDGPQGPDDAAPQHEDGPVPADSEEHPAHPEDPEEHPAAHPEHLEAHPGEHPEGAAEQHPGDFPEHHADDEFDPTLADDVLTPIGAHEDDIEEQPRRRRKHNPFVRIGAILVAAAVVVAGGILGFGVVRDMIPDLSFGESAPEDFEGTGSGEVEVEIPQGAGGGQIGQLLFDAGVVASAESFANTAAADPRATSIQPGTYTMAEQMSSAAALDRLVDPSARVGTGVTVREGLWQDEIFALLAEATGNDLADYEAVDPADLDLPEAANGELEGFLFPDTYEFASDSTPEQQLQAMIDLGQQRYAEVGLGDEEMREILIKASIVQGEGMYAEDLPKVARVVENRLAEGSETNGRLEMDSTIHFIHQERGRVGTTNEQREADSPYNTYQNEGLPPGPINSPGLAAIEAAMHPEQGDWEFFVTINPTTGETVFTETYEEHQEQVDIFLEWCEDNPDQC